MDVRSDENKILLSQILKSHPLKDINNNRFFKAIDNQVGLIYKERFKYNNDLTNMNKEVIRRFSVIADDIRNKQQSNQSINRKQNMNQNSQQNRQLNNGSKKLWREENMSDFEKKMKEQQDNFSKLANPKKPKEIDFRDNTEENGTMRSMDSAMAAREMELKEAMAEYNSESAAAKWIGNEEVNKNIKIDVHSNVSIEPEIINSHKRERQKKRVHFKISETTNQDTTSFLNKLKKIPNKIKANSDTKKELQEIIDMQRNLMERLEKVIKSL
jgi:hypothetical protein